MQTVWCQAGMAQNVRIWLTICDTCHTLDDVMKTTVLAPIVLLLALAVTAPAMGALSGGVDMRGGGSCRSISQYISDNWWDLRSFMTSDFGARKPRSNDFRCISPDATDGLVSKPVPGHSGMLQCYGRGADPKICCDRDLAACVQFSGH